jgi:hypothetical protein
MARRVNYGFEKFQKEAKRKKKQAEKLEKKRLKKENAATADGQSVPATDAVPVEEPAAPTTDNTTNS